MSAQRTMHEKLEARIERDPNSGCWLWSGNIKKSGYGYVWLSATKRACAHRYVYELHRGPVPDGLQLDHLCRTRCCVNPNHLEPVTARENARRGETGNHLRSRTHCPQGHPYDDVNTRYTMVGSRMCRECVRIQGRQRVQRRHALKIAGGAQ